MYEDIINALPGLPSVYKATHVSGSGIFRGAKGVCSCKPKVKIRRKNKWLEK